MRICAKRQQPDKHKAGLHAWLYEWRIDAVCMAVSMAVCVCAPHKTQGVSIDSRRSMHLIQRDTWPEPTMMVIGSRTVLVCPLKMSPLRMKKVSLLRSSGNGGLTIWHNAPDTTSSQMVGAGWSFREGQGGLSQEPAWRAVVRSTRQLLGRCHV